MRVFEVMSSRVRTVPPDTPVVSARELMEANRIDHLVVTEDHAVVGVVSRRDLDDATTQTDDHVRDVMASSVVTIGKTEPVRKAANLMTGRTIGCLPVTDGGRLVGIVTTADLLRLIGKGVTRPEPKNRRVVHHRVPHRKAHVASGRW